MANRWIEFVKDYASKHKLSYGCAISKPECKIAYRKKYPTAEQQKFREAVERGSMEDEDKNVIKKKKPPLIIEE